MPSKRLLFWIPFLGGASLLAAWSEFGPRPAPEVLPVAPRAPDASAAAAPRRADGPAAAASAAPADPPQRTALPAPAALAASAASAPLAAASAGALFLAQSWEPKPPPAPPAAPAPPAPPPPPPPPPAPPPLPFRFLGRMDDGPFVKVFLHNGERLYAVSVGDVVEGQFRLARVDPGQLTFVYLPMDATLVMPLGKPS